MTCEVLNAADCRPAYQAAEPTIMVTMAAIAQMNQEFAILGCGVEGFDGPLSAGMLLDNSAIRTIRERKTGDSSPSVIAVAKPGQIDRLRFTDRRHVSHASARWRSNSTRSSPSSAPKANR